MTLATLSASNEPARPQLTLIEGRAPDALLVARAVRGGSAGKLAEDELYRRYRAPVARLLATFADLDGDEIEDITQDAFVRAFRALEGLKERERFNAWLYTIARNRARSWLSSRHTRRVAAEDAFREANLLEDHAPAASVVLEKEAELRAVREVIEGLREGPEKETVRLFYLDGTLSAREIAAKMGVGKSAITMRLERFRAKVRAQIEERLAS